MSCIFSIADKNSQYIGPALPHKNTSSANKLSDTQQVKQAVTLGENLTRSMIGSSHTTSDNNNDNNYRVIKFI